MSRHRRPRSRLRGLISVPVTVMALLIGLFLGIRIADSPAAAGSFAPPSALPEAPAPLPQGPILFDSDRSGHFEVMKMAADGSGATALTSDPTYDSWWPKISPDRRTILFYRTPAGTHDRDFTVTSLWAMAADGSGVVELRPAGLDGWDFQGHAEWSPDGSHLVMFGGPRTNPQIFETTSTGTAPRQVTNRGGTNIDPSYSPDDSAIVFVGCPTSICVPAGYEVYRIPVAGGTSTRLTSDKIPDHDPYYSPDGTQIAWLSQISTSGVGVWDIRISNANGSGVHRLVGDKAINSKPQWSPDGQSIVFHRDPPGGSRFDIYRIGVDGSDLTLLTGGQPGNNEYPDL